MLRQLRDDAAVVKLCGRNSQQYESRVVVVCKCDGSLSVKPTGEIDGVRVLIDGDTKPLCQAPPSLLLAHVHVSFANLR